MTTPEDEPDAHAPTADSTTRSPSAELRLARDRAVVEAPAEQVAQEQRERLGAIADERAVADQTEGPVDG